jgi:hypothetical protein
MEKENLVEKALKVITKEEASAILFNIDRPPAVRAGGHLVRLESRAITQENAEGAEIGRFLAAFCHEGKLVGREAERGAEGFAAHPGNLGGIATCSLP